MERVVRVYSDNIIFEKALRVSGGIDQLAARLLTLPALARRGLKPADLELQDDWERGFTRVVVPGEVDPTLFTPADEVVILGQRHDYNPRAIRHDPADRAEPRSSKEDAP